MIVKNRCGEKEKNYKTIFCGKQMRIALIS